jgi:hypothetical protein
MPGLFFGKSFSGAAAASVLFGLPTAVAYCLIAGAPWRGRRPSEADAPPEAVAG